MAGQARIGLGETLKQLRQELAEAQAEGADKRLRFEVTEAEVEFAVELSKEATPGAKVKFDVVAIGGVELGADGKIARGSTHRITLKLAVKDKQTDRNAEVANDTRRSWSDGGPASSG
ncbi:trypco2 family protein [Nonomuraea wenchangensis]